MLVTPMTIMMVTLNTMCSVGSLISCPRVRAGGNSVVMNAPDKAFLPAGAGEAGCLRDKKAIREARTVEQNRPWHKVRE
ncbi:hypothetical protein JCM14635_11150 [Megalodesulfovibrio paquesii]